LETIPKNITFSYKISYSKDENTTHGNLSPFITLKYLVVEMKIRSAKSLYAGSIEKYLIIEMKM